MFSLSVTIYDDLGREVTLEQIRQKLDSPNLLMQIAEQTSQLLVEKAPDGTGALKSALEASSFGTPERAEGGWRVGVGNIAYLGGFGPAPSGTISEFLRWYWGAKTKEGQDWRFVQREAIKEARRPEQEAKKAAREAAAAIAETRKERIGIAKTRRSRAREYEAHLYTAYNQGKEAKEEEIVIWTRWQTYAVAREQAIQYDIGYARLVSPKKVTELEATLRSWRTTMLIRQTSRERQEIIGEKYRSTVEAEAIANVLREQQEAYLRIVGRDKPQRKRTK